MASWTSSGCSLVLLTAAMLLLIGSASPARGANLQRAAAEAEVEAPLRVRRDSYNYDCVRFCQNECSLWKGYDLKHCASMCTTTGLDGFSQNFVHDMCFNLGPAKRGMRTRFLEPLFARDGLQDDLE